MKKGLVAVFVVCMGLLSGCSGDEGEAPEVTSSTGRTTTTTSAVVDGKAINPFTGQYNLTKEDGNRPVAIMVPNDSTVWGYQTGLDKADLYFETETEAGITRIMAVFANVYRVPDKFGPIRSARSPFVATAREFGAVYVHAGGSKVALATLKTGVVDRFNALGVNSWSWRDSYLKKTLDTEHSLVLSGPKLTAAIEKKEWEKPAATTLPFTFGEKGGDRAAAMVQVSPSSNTRYATTWSFDKSTGLYTKNTGKIDNRKVLKTLEGNTVTVANVVVLYGERFVEKQEGKNTWYDFKTGSGTGYIASGGTGRAIRFTRSAEKLTLTEADGTPLVFAKGKTYLYLADRTLESKLILQ